MEEKRRIALEALEDGMSMHLIAGYVGVSIEQIRIWKESARHADDPIMSLHYAGMPPSQITRKLNITEQNARDYIVSVWKHDKDNKKGR